MRLAYSGPTTAPTIPPERTIAIAEAWCDAGTNSTAANRYSCGKAERAAQRRREAGESVGRGAGESYRGAALVCVCVGGGLLVRGADCGEGARAWPWALEMPMKAEARHRPRKLLLTSASACARRTEAVNAHHSCRGQAWLFWARLRRRCGAHDESRAGDPDRGADDVRPLPSCGMSSRTGDVRQAGDKESLEVEVPFKRRQAGGAGAVGGEEAGAPPSAWTSQAMKMLARPVLREGNGDPQGGRRGARFKFLTV